MITSYRPQTGRWAAASALALFASTWGGCLFFNELKRPRVSAPGGTAAAHVERGRRLLDSPCESFWDDGGGPSPEQVGVAVLEFEFALRIDPGDEAAILGKAECLEKIGDEKEDASFYRRAVDDAERVVQTSASPERRRNALWSTARLRTKLGQNRPALEEYQRLILAEPDAATRLEARYQAALSEEKLGLARSAFDDLRRLERWTGETGRFKDDLRRLAAKVGKVCDVPATKR